jgi:methionine synthase II (cobalamin-independent)
MSRRTSPPFRADHVGSLLRPRRLHQARDDFAAGRITAADLRAVEDEEIAKAVRMQEEVGLQSATDGEFRRATWHMDFIYALGGVSKAPGNLKVKFHNPSGDIEWTPAALHVDGKIHLDPAQRAEITGRGEDAEHMHLRYIKQINAAVKDRPVGLAVTTHLCRGNFRSSWAASGGYEFVAEALFSELDVDGIFLEYDDERSGGFEPLRFMPPGKMVVLGLVTTKRPELESSDDLKRRIDAAAKYVPLDQICLSGQCGFSSTVEGNVLTPAEQEAKLRLIVETAHEVWGD